MIVEVVHSRQQLVDRLRRLGIAGARLVSVAENLEGEQDGAIAFGDAQLQTVTIGFATTEIPLSVAHGVMRELTALVRQPTQKANKHTTLTHYIAP